MLEPSLGKAWPHQAALAVRAWALGAWSGGRKAGLPRLPVVGHAGLESPGALCMLSQVLVSASPCPVAHPP